MSDLLDSTYRDRAGVIRDTIRAGGGGGRAAAGEHGPPDQLFRTNRSDDPDARWRTLQEGIYQEDGKYDILEAIDGGTGVFKLAIERRNGYDSDDTDARLILTSRSDDLSAPETLEELARRALEKRRVTDIPWWDLRSDKIVWAHPDILKSDPRTGFRSNPTVGFNLPTDFIPQTIEVEATPHDVVPVDVVMKQSYFGDFGGTYEDACIALSELAHVKYPLVHKTIAECFYDLKMATVEAGPRVINMFAANGADTRWEKERLYNRLDESWKRICWCNEPDLVFDTSDPTIFTRHLEIIFDDNMYNPQIRPRVIDTGQDASGGKVRSGYPNANPINISGPIYVRAFYMSEDMDEPVYTDVTTEDKKLIVATILRSYTATVLPAKVLRLYTAPKGGPRTRMPSDDEFEAEETDTEDAAFEGAALDLLRHAWLGGTPHHFLDPEKTLEGNQTIQAAQGERAGRLGGRNTNHQGNLITQAAQGERAGRLGGRNAKHEGIQITQSPHGFAGLSYR